ncbi:MAG: Uma2 family endonuclease, partial [Deltaproteobacteria bacterium]|nr:Uma2 family endonuclease [Deltaproteobacteria bacterium]
IAQIIDGELVVSPRPAIIHSQASSVLGSDLLHPYFRGRGGPGGWWILDEPELHLGDDVLVPDLAGWRRARLPDPRGLAFIELAPDWICEVLSPSTAGIDRVRKLHIYGREHVAHVWLVDPAARTLEVLRGIEQGWLLSATHGGDERVRAEPFTEVELELSAWWGELPAKDAPP